ncbi:MAG TPA: DUF6785 family protein [Abditibacteriaceae bacterium]|jgi:hypothetical protein
MSVVPSTQEAEPEVRGGGVTARVVVLCLALAVFFGFVIPLIDVGLANTFLGAAHLPPGSIAVLLVLLLVINPLLKLFSERLKFSRNEMLTIYITTLFSCLVPGHGSESFFVSSLIGPYYFANASNKWMGFLTEHVAPWMTPALTEAGYNKEVVEGWYTGTKGVVPWAAWLGPLMAWGSLVFASYTMLGCLSVMLRAQWAEREALAFPLLRIPMELTEGSDTSLAKDRVPLLRNPLVWVGAGIAIFIQVVNGLNFYYPDFPKVALDINTGPLFTEAPWNQIGWIPMRVWPIVVGVTFLLTSEVSFSLWFFYWFMRFQLMLAFSLGFAPNAMPGLVGHLAGAKPFVGYQQIGAYIGFVAIVLWTAREHLKHVAKRAFGRAKRGEGEAQEALSYPAAFWGFILSFAFLIGWTCFAGVSPIIAFYIWTMYLVIAIGLTRVIAEGGLLFVQQGWVPMSALSQIIGSGPGTMLPASTVVPSAFIQGGLMMDMRGFIMPSFVQGFKLAHDRGIRARPLFALIFAVILISLTLGIYMNTRLGYDRGGLTLEGWFAQGGSKAPADNSQTLINGVPGVSSWNLGWVGLGAGLTYLMMVARSRFLWFPFHPIGYLVALTYPMNQLWFSIFLGWLCKVLITRFGGSDSYKKVTPAFLGLVLGEVLAMLFWLLIDGWQGTMRHQLMPG